MSIQLPLPILRRNPVQRIAHVCPHILVPVLVQAQRAARVLDEQVQQARLVRADLGQFGEDVVGYEVGAACAGGEG